MAIDEFNISQIEGMTIGEIMFHYLNACRFGYTPTKKEREEVVKTINEKGEKGAKELNKLVTDLKKVSELMYHDVGFKRKRVRSMGACCDFLIANLPPNFVRALKKENDPDSRRIYKFIDDYKRGKSLFYESLKDSSVDMLMLAPENILPSYRVRGIISRVKTIESAIYSTIRKTIKESDKLKAKGKRGQEDQYPTLLTKVPLRDIFGIKIFFSDRTQYDRFSQYFCTHTRRHIETEDYAVKTNPQNKDYRARHDTFMLAQQDDYMELQLVTLREVLLYEFIGKGSESVVSHQNKDTRRLNIIYAHPIGQRLMKEADLLIGTYHQVAG